MYAIRAFSQNYTTFFYFQKKGRWGHLYFPPPPNCTPASAAEYASISLNIPKYLWKCLKNSPDYATAMRCLIILHVQQDFEDALGSKCGKVLNMAPLYMQGLYRILNVSKHGSICLNNAWICLNISKRPSICLTMVEIFWVSLNIPENYWIKCWLCQSSQYASSSYTLKRVLNMLQILNMPGFWIYCDIVIIITLLL